MKSRRLFLFLIPFFFLTFSACEPQGGTNNVTGTPPPMLEGELPSETPPEGLVDGGISPPSPEEAPPVQVRPGSTHAPLFSPEAIASGDISVGSCFDFAFLPADRSWIPMVVYEKRTRTGRELVFTEKTGGVWREHTLLSVGAVPNRSCHFLPALQIDASTVYVAARGDEGNHLKIMARRNGSWSPLTLAGVDQVGESNIDILKVGDYNKIIYRGILEEHVQIVCITSNSDVEEGCTEEFRALWTGVRGSSYFYLLPWINAGGDTFALQFRNYTSSSLYRVDFGRERVTHNELPDFPPNPSQFAMTMGPTAFRLNVVFKTAAGNALGLCAFQNSGEQISCETVGANGEYPSIHMGAGGRTVVSYFDSGMLKLAMRGNLAAPWSYQFLSGGKGGESEKRSIVKLGLFNGALNAHVVFTGLSDDQKTKLLRYIRVP